MMNQPFIQWFAVIDTACWLICFWWMPRIFSRQDALLKALREQGTRIEGLSKVEHDLVKEMHPIVQSMEDDISAVANAAKPDKK